MPALPVSGIAVLSLLVLVSAARDSVPEKCKQYSDLYRAIDRDLAIYKKNGGIKPNLIYRTMTMHTAGYREKGLAVAFYNGKAYVISNKKIGDLSRFGHHVVLWVAYLKVVLHLEATYGSDLPNVEFVWHTIDRPVRLTNATAGAEDNFPVFRFCKSKANPDILIPIYHFYMKRYQSEFLDRMSDMNAEVPWQQRLQKAFARFTGYGRYVHPNDTHTQRLDAEGKSLCQYEGTTTAICPVREYLVEWAAKYPDRLDILTTSQVPMKRHAEFRYLVHVDGQGLSSKLELLLTLGSLVMKEESGYMAFYHHLLEPYKHYVPVWKPGSGPQDILEAVDWAMANDGEARKIAMAGQAFAARYLSREARECYWLRLLKSYAETLAYDPVAFREITVGEGGEVVGRWKYIMPVQRFLDEVVPQFFPDAGKGLQWEV